LAPLRGGYDVHQRPCHGFNLHTEPEADLAMVLTTSFIAILIQDHDHGNLVNFAPSDTFTHFAS
jgi:hypothetical protein